MPPRVYTLGDRLCGLNADGVTRVSSRARGFDRDGYLVVQDLLHPEEIAWYREIYDRLLSGEIDAGGMLHYSHGNTTAGHRRALIVNFRPRAMIEYERSRGFDHGKSAPGRENRNARTR